MHNTLIMFAFFFFLPTQNSYKIFNIQIQNARMHVISFITESLNDNITKTYWKTNILRQILPR